MKMKFDEMLGQITDFMQNEARTETVVGEQFTLGEFNCIPVIRVGMGFGSGGGEGDDSGKNRGEGGAAGGGMGIEPIGFLVSYKDQIQFVSTRQNKGLAAAFEKVPELISRYLDMQEKETEPV